MRIDHHGNVGIGTTSPTAKLHIVGGADTQQLIVKGNATQTSNLMEWQNSAGTVLASINSIGTGNFVPPITADPSASRYALVGRVDVTTNSAYASATYGFYGGVNIAGSGNITGSVYGLRPAPAHKGTGTVTSIYGLNSIISNESTGIVSYAYGLYVSSFTNTGGGSYANKYGLYIEYVSGGTSTNYAIYTQAGIVHLGDKLEFTQTDGNEAIDSLADGYMDYLATTGHRFDRAVTVTGNVDATTFSVASAAGVDGTFTSADIPPKVITVSKGIIIGIV